MQIESRHNENHRLAIRPERVARSIGPAQQRQYCHGALVLCTDLDKLRGNRRSLTVEIGVDSVGREIKALRDFNADIKTCGGDPHTATVGRVAMRRLPQTRVMAAQDIVFRTDKDQRARSGAARSATVQYREKDEPRTTRSQRFLIGWKTQPSRPTPSPAHRHRQSGWRQG